MIHILKLAWRNLWRNRRRTLITGTALVIGMGMCIMTYGYMDGLNNDILHALTRLDLGDVQITNPEYPAEHLLKYTLPDPAAILNRVKDFPGVLSASPRVYAYGLASHVTKSLAVQLVGVDPSSEPSVTEMNRETVAGTYLDPQPTPWPEGRALTHEEKRQDAAMTADAEKSALDEISGLSPMGSSSRPPSRHTIRQGPPVRSAAPSAGQWTQRILGQLDPPPASPPPVFIGATLAKLLGVHAGDKMYILTQTLGGSSSEVQFRVIGIFRTGTELYDRGRVYMNIRDLQRFLHLGSGIHQIVLRVSSPDKAYLLAGQLKHLLPDKDVLVRSWDTIRPDIKGMLGLNDASSAIMIFIIFVVASLGVVNTMLMSVLERTREFGMLKAIGMSGSHIILMVLLETLFLSILSSLAGTALGLGLDLYMAVYGLNLSSLIGEISFGGMGVSPVVHAVVTARGLIMPVVVLVFLCFAAAFYPAARAARVRPVKAMREV